MEKICLHWGDTFYLPYTIFECKSCNHDVFVDGSGGLKTIPVKIKRNLCYKGASSRFGHHVLITLCLPVDARTNQGRKDIVDAQYAKYRSDKAFVLKIEDEYGNYFVDAVPRFYRTTREEDYDENGALKFVYRVGEVIECPKFDRDIEKVWVPGIHYFVDKTVALSFQNERTNGLHIRATDNGTLTHKYNIKDGSRDGNGFYRNISGGIVYEQEYKNGTPHGKFTMRTDKGVLLEQVEYVDGERHGWMYEYRKNGSLHRMIYYDKGCLKGIAKEWNEHGKLIYEENFDTHEQQFHDGTGAS